MSPRSQVAAIVVPPGKAVLLSAVASQFRSCFGRAGKRTISDTHGRVLQTQAAESQAGYGAVLANASLLFPANTRGQIDLLEQGKLRDKGAGF